MLVLKQKPRRRGIRAYALSAGKCLKDSLLRPSGKILADDYLLENCGARRAALRPYCFLPYGRKLLILLGFLGFHASVNPSVHPFRILFGVAPFFGANALFTTEDNSLGLLYFTLA